MKPKNWSHFQHYKDRCPPWIKLHKELLNDRAYMTLPTASKALAPLLWLLASESKDGTFDASIDELMFRLRMPESDIKTGLKHLIDKGFFVDDSNVLADRYQDAIPETETEREAETKTEAKLSQDKPAKRKQKVSMPDDFGISEKVALWAKENNFDRLNDHLDAFKRKAEMNGYRYVNWDLAFMEAIREDWAKLRSKPSFAQQAADVARTTVPPPPNQDAALKQIIADRENCSPPPAHIREMMKGILGVKNA